MTTYRHLVSLGSSFASGPGIDPIVDRSAGRSGRNYPAVLAAELGAQLTDLTRSGARTGHLLDVSQRHGVRRARPQLDVVPPDADLVTITAGGNDLGYLATAIRLGIVRRVVARGALGAAAARLAPSPAATPTGDDVARVAGGLARVVDAVRARTPGARVVLVDYLPVVGAATLCSRESPFTRTDLAALREWAEAVAEVFRRAGDATGADVVAMSEHGRAHALGTSRPWVTGMPERLGDLRTRIPFHPNADGMRATAAEVVRALSR